MKKLGAVSQMTQTSLRSKKQSGEGGGGVERGGGMGWRGERVGWRGSD